MTIRELSMLNKDWSPKTVLEIEYQSSWEPESYGEWVYVKKHISVFDLNTKINEFWDKKVLAFKDTWVLIEV